MPKAIILTVGAQVEQIIFMLNQRRPDYLGILHTATAGSCEGVAQIARAYPLPPTHCRALEVRDDPAEIGAIISNFHKLYEWLISEKGLTPDDIACDPTGGRKWMSAGLTMIASYLGLEMLYVDVLYRDGKPDPKTMRLIALGNAYRQTGFLHEAQADVHFNNGDYLAAGSIYRVLAKSVNDPRTVEIKLLISDGLLGWGQLRFADANKNLKEAVQRVDQYSLLTELRPQLNDYVQRLEILSQNDAPGIDFFRLIGNEDFSREIIHTMVVLAKQNALRSQYNEATILLYRVLELIAQARLAVYGVDVGNVSEDVKSAHEKDFRLLSQKLHGADSGIKDKLALVDSWMLLLCMNDPLVSGCKEIRKIMKKAATRNNLWVIHRNCHVDLELYEEFRVFVEEWVEKHDTALMASARTFQFLKFQVPTA
jgi:CRISPR-associated protein (TIGR02710 family)